MSTPASVPSVPPVDVSQSAPSSSQDPALLAAAGDGSASGSVSTMGDLREQSPEVYQAMLQGIGMQICRRMEDGQQRIKKIHQEARAKNEG